VRKLVDRPPVKTGAPEGAMRTATFKCRQLPDWMTFMRPEKAGLLNPITGNQWHEPSYRRAPRRTSQRILTWL